MRPQTATVKLSRTGLTVNKMCPKSRRKEKRMVAGLRPRYSTMCPEKKHSTMFGMLYTEESSAY